MRVRGRALEARTVQFVPKTWGEWQTRGDESYFVAQFELHHQAEGFVRRIVHRGFKALDMRTGQLDRVGRQLPPVVYRIKDESGEIKEPHPLDDKGRAWRQSDPLDAADVEPNDDLSRPLARSLTEEQFARTILEEEVEREADFSVIPRTFG